ncbi:PAS domain-containing protein [Phyllobacterium sp. 628]|uniref:PAS domain-containing protein n=1 Tax=Phyllobacterium sp. 628 TaxID=2718938 RepID=UPI0016624D93|nr:PAS domain-containing protein [Phyllobacterium sp. 628]QND53087.1 PAS domain-containing protein [Phyllobacterium sp. 628]
MRHDGTSEIFAYWNNLRGTRAAPERREISPALIRSRLSDIFLLRANGVAEARFRLAGTRICSIYGRELKGQTFTSIWQAKDKPIIARIVSSSLTTKTVVRSTYEGKSSRGRKTLFNLILLPLANEVNERHLLGMITNAGKPFWLESDAIIENSLRSISMGDPHSSTPTTIGSALLEAHKSPIPNNPQPVPGTSRRVGHLMVFDGGKIID